MPTPDEAAFVTFNRGQVRDFMLDSFREGLRQLVNPATNQLFTDEEIRIATQEGSRQWLKFDAIDLYGQASQTRARFTAQQTDPRRATSSWLRGFHARQWRVPPLSVSSGIGKVSWQANIGEIFPGSTTLGDPTAFVARDATGNLYQAYGNVTTPGGGIAELTMVAVNGGGGTNPQINAVFTSVANEPLNAAQTGTVITNFEGGFDPENDADLLSRIEDRIAHKPASGNNAQFRAWTRAASVAVQSAWVYCCALNAGTVIVAFTMKRSAPELGPLARIPTDALLTQVRTYLTPPGSVVTPARPFVLAHKPVSNPISMVVLLGMKRAAAGGWTDATPWPTPLTPTGGDSFTSFSKIITGPSGGGTIFRVSSGTGLPTGVDKPSMMIWNKTKTRFEKLFVDSVADAGGGEFDVVLVQAPSFSPAINDIICPDTGLRTIIAEAAESYFDSLGPGELVNLATDPRAADAFRWPEPNESEPYVAGQSIGSFLFDALGSGTSSVSASFVSQTTPLVPLDLSTFGPGLITLNYFGVYPA